MGNKWILLIIGVLISFHANAETTCVYTEFQKSTADQQELIKSLDVSDFKFEADITTNSVRGVISANYYYCENDQGFLLVQFNDKELLYKDVPLQTWLEFKFSKEYTSYYKEQIKYNYISI